MERHNKGLQGLHLGSRSPSTVASTASSIVMSSGQGPLKHSAEGSSLQFRVCCDVPDNLTLGLAGFGGDRQSITVVQRPAARLGEQSFSYFAGPLSILGSAKRLSSGENSSP
jgi:hypothetical protein